MVWCDKGNGVAWCGVVWRDVMRRGVVWRDVMRRGVVGSAVLWCDRVVWCGAE